MCEIIFYIYLGLLLEHEKFSSHPQLRLSGPLSGSLTQVVVKLCACGKLSPHSDWVTFPYGAPTRVTRRRYRPAAEAFTLFAPTNAALDGVNLTRAELLFHAAPEQVNVSDVKDEQLLDTFNAGGPQIRLNVYDDDVSGSSAQAQTLLGGR